MIYVILKKMMGKEIEIYGYVVEEDEHKLKEVLSKICNEEFEKLKETPNKFKIRVYTDDHVDIADLSDTLFEVSFLVKKTENLLYKKN